jgi:hypothetical protein
VLDDVEGVVEVDDVVLGVWLEVLVDVDGVVEVDDVVLAVWLDERGRDGAIHSILQITP